MQQTITSKLVSLLGSAVAGCGKYLRRNVVIRRRERRLRLCETLSLGEKRFLAVVALDKERFLIGATSHSLALLAKLAPQREAFSDTPLRVTGGARVGWDSAADSNSYSATPVD